MQSRSKTCKGGPETYGVIPTRRVVTSGTRRRPRHRAVCVCYDARSSRPGESSTALSMSRGETLTWESDCE